MLSYPNGVVVELGCDGETSFHRCDNGKVRWICLGTPETIHFSKPFLESDKRCQYLSQSALDLSWMDNVDCDVPIFVSVRGLFRNFTEEQVGNLVGNIFGEFEHVVLMFDVMPEWFSKKNRRARMKRQGYRVQTTPWRVNYGRMPRLAHLWCRCPVNVTQRPYRFFRGLKGYFLEFLGRIPVFRDLPPRVVCISTLGRRRSLGTTQHRFDVPFSATPI
jgi:hypothetical protein